MWVKIWIYLNRNPINSFDHSVKFELHWFMLCIMFSVEFPPPQRRCAENTHWNPYFIFNDDSQYFLVNAEKIECVFPFTPFVITSCRWIQTMDSMYNEITNRLRKKKCWWIIMGLIHYLEFLEHFIQKSAHMLGCAAFQRRLFKILECHFEQINCFITISINIFAFEHQMELLNSYQVKCKLFNTPNWFCVPDSSPCAQFNNEYFSIWLLFTECKANITNGFCSDSQATLQQFYQL